MKVTDGTLSGLDPAYLAIKEKLMAGKTSKRPIPKRLYGRTKEKLSIIGFGGMVVKDVTLREAATSYRASTRWSYAALHTGQRNGPHNAASLGLPRSVRCCRAVPGSSMSGDSIAGFRRITLSDEAWRNWTCLIVVRHGRHVAGSDET